MGVLAGVRSGHHGELRVAQLEGLDGARFDERDQREGFDRRPEIDQYVRIADAALDPAAGVDLDDVAAVTALDGCSAPHFNENRRGHVLGVAQDTRRRPTGSFRCASQLRLGHEWMVPNPIGAPIQSAAMEFENLHVSSHPAIQHKLALLRTESVEPKKFRELVREISWLLGYEALADARLMPVRI